MIWQLVSHSSYSGYRGSEFVDSRLMSGGCLRFPAKWPEYKHNWVEDLFCTVELKISLKVILMASGNATEVIQYMATSAHYV